MRKLLRRFIEWSDKKWPDMVEVTMAEYLTLKAKIDVLEKSQIGERLNKIEAEINKFNVSLGFSGDLSRKLGSFQR